MSLAWVTLRHHSAHPCASTIIAVAFFLFFSNIWTIARISFTAMSELLIADIFLKKLFTQPGMLHGTWIAWRAAWKCEWEKCRNLGVRCNILKTCFKQYSKKEYMPLSIPRYATCGPFMFTRRPRQTCVTWRGSWARLYSKRWIFISGITWTFCLIYLNPGWGD